MHLGVYDLWSDVHLLLRDHHELPCEHENRVDERALKRWAEKYVSFS